MPYLSPWDPKDASIYQTWGPAPRLEAAPIAGIAAVIAQQRAAQQKQIQQGMSDLAGAIEKQRLDQVANTLAQQYSNAGMIPQELTGQGTEGLGAATDYIKAQQYRTYPTTIGGQTYPLTQSERVKLAIAGQRARMYGGGADGELPYGFTYDQAGNIVDPSGNLYRPGHYGPVPLATALQPSVVQQRQQAASTRGLPQLQTFFGTQVDPKTGHSVRRSVSDFDFDNAWENEDGDKVIPVLNPKFNRTLPADQQTELAYKQKANPDFDKSQPASVNNSPTITDTITIPKKVYNRAFGIPSDQEDTTPPPAAGLGATPSTSYPLQVPNVGDVVSGYRFKGGDPANQNNWEKVP